MGSGGPRGSLRYGAETWHLRGPEGSLYFLTTTPSGSRFSESLKKKSMTQKPLVPAEVRGSFRKIPKGGGRGTKACRKTFGGACIVNSIKF